MDHTVDWLSDSRDKGQGVLASASCEVWCNVNSLFIVTFRPQWTSGEEGRRKREEGLEWEGRAVLLGNWPGTLSTSVSLVWITTGGTEAAQMCYSLLPG